jgi:uncharacterized protein YndB with AHSA1/START domain
LVSDPPWSAGPYGGRRKSVQKLEWLTTITFEEIDGKTKLPHSILHRSVEIRDGHLQTRMEAGTVQTLNRLAEHVALMAEVGVTNR